MNESVSDDDYIDEDFGDEGVWLDDEHWARQISNTSHASGSDEWRRRLCDEVIVNLLREANCEEAAAEYERLWL